MKRVILILAFLFITEGIFAQNVEVGRYLNMVAKGRTDEVKQILPDLMVAYPNDPGVKLITASVIQDAYKALEIYNEIAVDHPTSEWADDALWRIIQFHAIMGDSQKADLGLDILRKKYPDSEYIVPATDIVRSSMTLSDLKKEKAIKETPKVEKLEMTNFEEVQQKATAKMEKKLDEIDEVKEERKRIKEPLVKEEITEVKMGGGDLGDSSDNLAKDILTAHIEQEKENSVEEQRKRFKENLDIAFAGTGTGTYGLQVGVYASREAADAEMAKFINQRMRTELLAMEKDNEILYAVVIGNYSSRKSAEAAKIIVNQQCGCNLIILEK